MVSIAEYKKELAKQPKRNKRKEGELQEQIKLRFEQYKCWGQLRINAIFVHIPNERIFGGAIASFLKGKECPLTWIQIKWMNFYLAGFAKNLAKAGAFKGFLDNMIIVSDGRIIFFELKVDKNKPSPEQQDLMNTLQAFGYAVYLLYTIDDFDEMLGREMLLKSSEFKI